MSHRLSMHGELISDEELRLLDERREQDQKKGCTSLQWHAIADGELCSECARRKGLQWRYSGNPIGHNVAFAEPPIHDHCRCILLPMQVPDE